MVVNQNCHTTFVMTFFFITIEVCFLPDESQVEIKVAGTVFLTTSVKIFMCIAKSACQNLTYHC